MFFEAYNESLLTAEASTRKHQNVPFTISFRFSENENLRLLSLIIPPAQKNLRHQKNWKTGKDSLYKVFWS